VQAAHVPGTHNAEEATFRLARLHELLEREAQALRELGDQRLLPVLVEIDELTRELARTLARFEPQADGGSRDGESATVGSLPT
jgi:hypothetical protein